MSQWDDDCRKWRGEVLTGEHGHWCEEWDGLPVDETCREWPCGCYVLYPDGLTRQDGKVVPWPPDYNTGDGGTP